MEDALNNLFFCCTFWEGNKACVKKNKRDYQRDRRGRRGRSRTRRSNTNSSLDSHSTRLVFEFALEEEKTNEKKDVAESRKKNDKKYLEDTIKDARKPVQRSRCRQPPSVRTPRKMRTKVLRQGHSKSETIEKKNEKKNPKDLIRNGRKQDSAKKMRQKSIPVSRTTQNTALSEGHSKAKKTEKTNKEKRPDNEKRHLISLNGGQRIPFELSDNRLGSAQGTTSRQQRKKSTESPNNRYIKRERKIKTTNARANSMSTTKTNCISMDSREETEMRDIMDDMESLRQEIFEKSAARPRLLKKFGSIPRKVHSKPVKSSLYKLL